MSELRRTNVGSDDDLVAACILGGVLGFVSRLDQQLQSVCGVGERRDAHRAGEIIDHRALAAFADHRDTQAGDAAADPFGNLCGVGRVRAGEQDGEFFAA